jgi:hypothetical protein
LGESPTGKRMEVDEVFFFRVEDGMFVYFWGWRTASTGWGSWASFPEERFPPVPNLRVRHRL